LGSRAQVFIFTRGLLGITVLRSIFEAMRTTVVALACLACAGLARRLQSRGDEQLPGLSYAEEQRSRLAKLLLEFNPAAAFNPSGMLPIAARSSPRVPAGARSSTGPLMATKGVVITGGAGGVGYAYADSFMKRGHWVVICDVKDPEPAVQALRQKHEGGLGKVHGCICDVSKAESVEALGEFAKEKLGTIHYWINNAGINGGRRPFSTLSTDILEAVVKVNLVGIILCTKVAQTIMQEQEGVESHVFNTVGSGVKGGGTPGYVAYGATKRGLPQMTESLVKEVEGGVPGFDVPKPKGKVNFHTLSPGMVFTDLLLNDSTPELRKFPFGVLAAQPEEVGEDLVPKILDTNGNGKSVEFLTTDKVLMKFFQKFIQGKKSEYIDDDGNVIKMPGAQYLDNGVRKLY